MLQILDEMSRWATWLAMLDIYMGAPKVWNSYCLFISHELWQLSVCQH